MANEGDEGVQTEKIEIEVLPFVDEMIVCISDHKHFTGDSYD